MMIHGSYQQDELIRVDGMPMSMMDGSGAPVLGTPSDGMTEETVISLGANTAEVETGGVYVNIIPRTGANRFSGGLSASFASDALQWSNATDAQRRQGQGTSGVKLLSDVNPTFGGPILRDRLWFFASYRDRHTDSLYPILPDTDNTDWVYTPDIGHPETNARTNWDVSSRVTLQASPRHKFDVGVTAADDFWPLHNLTGALQPPNALNYTHYPNRYTQLKWTSPVTSRLLLEAAGQLAFAGWKGAPPPGTVAPAAFEQSNGFILRSAHGIQTA